MRRTLLTGSILAAALLASPAVHAQSQQPSISSAWGSMRLSQDECFQRARAVLQRLNYQRIERIGNTTFGDRGNFQLAYRCVSEKEMFYVFGGGPGDQDRQLDRYINELKDNFDR